MIQALRLAVALLLFGYSTQTSVASDKQLEVNYTNQCMEELQLNSFYFNPSVEKDRNRTCLIKCTFEKLGKIDSKGNFVISKFPSDEQKGAEKCLKLIKSDDLCKRSQAVMNCVYKQTNEYFRKYDVCEEFATYLDKSVTDCFLRCQMIVDGLLFKNGSANVSAIDIFSPNPNNTVTSDKALKMCSKIVTDDDACVRDLNMYNCVSYVLNHLSEEVMKKEIRCGKETNVYPFSGTQTEKPRTCFDRCVLLASGDWDEKNPMDSKAFKKLGMSKVKVEEAFNTCKMTLQETDRCTKDMYFYDCVNYLNYADAKHAKQQVECSLETKTPLIRLRNDYNENHCKARCMMVKEGQIDNEGNINRTNLERRTINSTLVDQTLEFCNSHKKGNSCIEDMVAYYCAISKIYDFVVNLCSDGDSNNIVKENSCYLRCIMINSKQLDLNGEVLVDSIMTLANVTVDVAKKAIENCKARNQDKESCAKDVDTERCANSEVWRVIELKKNRIDTEN